MRDYSALLESKGIEFALVLLPFRGELKRNRYDELDGLARFSLHHQITVIDTKPYLYRKLLEHDKRLADIYWPIDNHFTERGYRYFAEAVEAGLHGTIDRAKSRATK